MVFNTKTIIQLSYLCRYHWLIGLEIRVVIGTSSYGLVFKTYFHHLYEPNDILMELVRRTGFIVHPVMRVQSEMIKGDFRQFLLDRRLSMCTCVLISFGPVHHLVQSAE